MIPDLQAQAAAPDLINPFPNGTTYGAWRARNCYRCTLYNPEQYDGRCEIDGALGLAYIGSGEISVAIAARLGWTAARASVAPECPEVSA